MPPQVRCNITGKFHYYDDECDCEVNDDTAIRIKEPSEEELEKLRDILSEHSFIETIAPVEYCTSCLVCGELIPVSVYENHVKICEDCKKAIMFIKERFKGDYDV
jgi:uncharacterized protein YajQ (UPF0234 family)